MSNQPLSRSASTRTPSGSVRNKEAHDAVLNAAAEILNETGYGGFTIETVARRSGSGKPTIYRWWKTRADLFMEVYNRESAALMPVADLGSAREELLEQMRTLFHFWSHSACGGAFRALIAESQSSAEALAQLRDQFLPTRRELARVILMRAIGRGEFKRTDAIEGALDALYGFTFYRLLTDQISPDDPAIALFVDTLLAGLRGLPVQDGS